MKKGDKVYVTKYAVTQGILTEFVTLTGKKDIYVCKDPDAGLFQSLQCRLEVDVFSDRAVAEQDAKRRVIRKVASLKKQIVRLEEEWGL